MDSNSCFDNAIPSPTNLENNILYYFNIYEELKPFSNVEFNNVLFIKKQIYTFKVQDFTHL